MHISRRTVLQGAISTAGLVVLSDASPPAATASSTQNPEVLPAVDINNSSTVGAVTFEAGWAQSYVALFPMDIALTPGDECTLTVTWDSRLFEITGSALLTVKGQISSVAFTKSGGGVATVRLPLGTERVFLPNRAINLYPSENIGTPHASVIRIGSTRGDRATNAELPIASEDVVAWGAEVAVDWISLSGQLTPTRATIKSVGPSPIDRGVKFLFIFPDSAGHVAETTLDGAEDYYVSISTENESGVVSATIETTKQIPAGTSTYLKFVATVSDSEPTTINSVVPRLTLLSETVPRGMRTTQMTSSFPITDVGSHLSTYVAVDTDQTASNGEIK